MSTHVHDWYVLDVCRDYCRVCVRVKRVCPRRHRHPTERFVR